MGGYGGVSSGAYPHSPYYGVGAGVSRAGVPPGQAPGASQAGMGAEAKKYDVVTAVNDVPAQNSDSSDGEDK